MSPKTSLPSVSRRAFLGMSASALLLAACAAPASPSGSPTAGASQSGAAPAATAPATNGQPIVLEMTFPAWIIDVNPSVNKLSAQYTQQTGVKINVSKSPTDIEQKVLIEAQQKKSTWHGIEGYAAWATVAKWVEGDALANWDKLIEKSDFDDLLPTAQQEMSYKGQLWLFPYRVSPIGIGWRPSINKDVGLPDHPPTSWEEFLTNAQAIEKAKSTSSKRFYGNAMVIEARYTFYSLIQSLNTSPYDYDKGLIKLDLPEVPQALELLKKLASFSPPEALSGDVITAGSTGQVGQIAGHLLTMFRIKAPLKGDLLTQGMPKITNNRTNYWSSGPMIMKHAGQIEEGAKYWLWLSKQKALYDEMWVINGSPPNRKSVFKQFEPMKGKELDAGIWDVVAQQEQSPPMPNSLWFPIQHTIAGQVLADYVAGKISTPQEVIATIDKKTDEAIAKQKK